jgi:hypothetical protein
VLRVEVAQGFLSKIGLNLSCIRVPGTKVLHNLRIALGHCVFLVGSGTCSMLAYVGVRLHAHLSEHGPLSLC